MKLNPVRYIWLRIWGDRSVIAAVIRFPTAPRQVWCSPPLTEARCETLAAFFFFLQFCILFSWAAPISTCLLFCYSTSPIIRDIFYILLHLIFFSFFFYPLCTKRRSVGGGEGAEIRRKTEDKGCTLSSFCFRVSKARSPAWLPCELLCEGARRRSPRPVKHCSLFFLSPPHCGQSWGKIFSRRGKGSSVLWSRVCVCTTVHTLLWEEPPPTCAAFQHLFINFTPL